MGDISKLQVGPDDVVLFKIVAPVPISQVQLEEVGHKIRALLVGVTWLDRIMVIDGATVEVSVRGKQPN